jgi:hypothetical protein
VALKGWRVGASDTTPTNPSCSAVNLDR